DQHTRVLRKCLADRCLCLAVEPQTLELVIRGVVEHRIQGPARYGFTLLDQLQRAADTAERQIETGGVAVGTAGIERHYTTADIDDRRPRRAARGARGRLEVKRVEVVVFGNTVFRSIAIQPRQRAREYRQLLAGIVADDADLATHLGP